MGLLTRKTDSNPLSKNIDELLDGMNQEREETKEGTYEESLKKIEERIKELGFRRRERRLRKASVVPFFFRMIKRPLYC